MFFQESQLQEPIAVATNVIYSLASAFAAGFAIQRLIEILDSWISIAKWVGAVWKAAVLNAISLAVGIALAYKLGIQVLDAVGQSIVGPDVSEFIDYVVSGLIISAGTEGLNSIVKFLSYAKEVKKAEVVTEQHTPISVRGMRSLAVAAPISFVSPITGDPLVDVETFLHDEMKSTKPWKEKFIEGKWKEAAFGTYTPHEIDAKHVVLIATEGVAAGYSKKLKKKSILDLQAIIKLNSKPDDLFAEMSAAVEDAYPFEGIEV